MKRLGKQEKGRRLKCKQRLVIISKPTVFAKQDLNQGTNKLMKKRLVPARVFGHVAFGFKPTERLKLRRDTAQRKGQNLSTSLNIFL